MIEAMQSAGAQIAKLSLDAAALRHQAIAQNIANLHSVDYVPLTVDFDAQLAAARRGQAAKPALVEDAERGVGPRPQDVDREMLSLSQNTLHYQALIRGLTKHLAILNTAISEGRGR
jgi:flagellar basal-body rod protein FlgB